MNSEEDIAVQLTQSTLGKYVTKPNLSEKLLKKPPFRFLHDIICVTVKDTGYLKGLFSDDELVSTNVKERDAKIAFLNKLISAVKATTKVDLKVRSSKIIAGLEPVETNKLLQAIAKAIEDKIDTTDYVSSLSGMSKGKSRKPIQGPTKTKESRSLSKSTTKSEETNQKTKAKSREAIDKFKEPPSTTRSSNNAASEKKIREKKTVGKRSNKSDQSSSERKAGDGKMDDRLKRTKIETPKEKPLKENDKNEIEPIQTHVQNIPGEELKSISQEYEENMDEDNDEKKKSELQANISNVKTNFGKDGDIPKPEIKAIAIERPKTAKLSKPTQPKTEIDEGPEKILNEDSIVQDTPLSLATRQLADPSGDDVTTPSIAAAAAAAPSAPPSARKVPVAAPAPPRPRSSLRPPSARPGTARPAAPRLRPPSALPAPSAALDGHVPSIGGAGGGGKVKVVVESFGAHVDGDDDEEDTVLIEQDPLDPTPSTNADSGTVEAAAASKSHLVGQIMAQVGEEGGAQLAAGGGRSKPPAALLHFQDKPAAALGASIQTVTQSANNLGHLMGYLHEDVDAMRAELEQWVQVGRATMAAADRRRSELAARTRPLRQRLEEVEAEVRRQREEIATLQCSVCADQTKIESLLRGVVAGVGGGGGGGGVAGEALNVSSL